MSLKRLFFVFIFILILFSGFVFNPNKAFLYSPETTHYNLSQEIIKFYNLTYEPDLTSRQTELILRGTIDEDIKPRPLFHLYDPVYNRSPAQVLGIDLVYTAKQWALTNSQESIIVKFGYVLWNFFKTGFEYHGNYSWPASVNYFVDGDSDKAYYGLGHLLHLIEDMTVPAHSRNDPHVGGDPYENWANINNGTINFNLAEPLYNKRYRPADFYTIGEYFDNLAMYSNRYFFSEDSILNKDYDSPKIIGERQEDFGLYSQRTYGLGAGEDGEQFRLVEVVKDLLVNKKVYLIQNDDSKLNTDYWARLAPKSVLYGAGVIRLFVEEAEWEKKLAEKQKPEPSFFQKAQIFIQDLFGIGDNKEAPQPSVPPVPLPQPKLTNFPASQPIVRPIEKPIETPLSKESNNKEQPADTQGEVKGESTKKEQGENKGGAVVVTGPKTGGEGGTSFREEPKTSQSAVGGEEPQDTVPPDILIESIIYNYASSSLTIAWFSSEIPAVSFDVEYKQDIGEWQSLLASTSETQTSLSVSIQDIIYYFRIKGRDEAGNESAWQEKSIEILSKPVVINEIAWMGTSASYNDEWIELYNRADYDIDLSDWILEATDGTPTVNFTGIISSHSYFLLERTNDETIANILADQIYTGGLENNGENLTLKDYKGNIIDQIDCGIGWYAGENESKRTMERISPAGAGNDSQNWQTYIGLGSGAFDAEGNPILGTPKARNSVYDITPPSKVNDLAISDSLGTFLVLQWTAPSDEKSSLSLTYDIRYASESISEENWASASQVSDIPAVENPGALQTLNISGLKYETIYYFAIKTSDGLNISELSNVLVYSIGSPPNLARSSWPVFQRDVGHTGYTSYAGPDFIASSSVNTKWATNLDSAVHASPVIGSDGTIYVGDIMGEFYAINPNNGNIKWVFDTYNYELGRGGVYFSAVVASDGTIYFFAGGDSYLYALTPNGKLKWKYHIGNPNITGSSPIIASDGTIYLTDNSTNIFAINPDGTLKWKYYLDGAVSVSASALGSDETIYTAWNGSFNTGYITALDVDGNHKWTSENINASAGQAPTIDSNDVIYVVSAFGSLRAINSATGFVNWFYNIGPSFSSAAIGSNGIIYTVNQNGVLQSNNSDGTPGTWTFSIGSMVRNSPIIDSNEVIYFGSDDKKIYAINPDGTLKWNYELTDAVYASPIIDDSGTIYIATADGTLYAIGE